MKKYGLVSVIVPVYNVMEYIDACFNSIVRQTYKNLEVILVDDGSVDGSGEYCDRLGEEDERVRVIHKVNGGLSSARNAGMDLMTGDYVTFVDSDDTIEERMIEICLRDLIVYDADIVECGVNHIYKTGVKKKSCKRKDRCVNTEEALLLDLSARGSIASPAKIFRKKILAQERFPEGRENEEQFMIIPFLSKAEKIVFNPECLYNYYHRKNSITTNTFSDRKLDCMRAAKRNLEIVKNKYPNALPGAIFRYDHSALYVMDKILALENWKDNVYFMPCQKMIRRHMRRIISSPYFSRSRKAALFILMFNTSLYRSVVLQGNEKRLMD